MIKKIVVVIAGVGALVAGSAYAFADSPRAFGHDDAQFRAEVQQRLSDLSHINHRSVCTNPVLGEASCTARMVTDSAGTPKTATLPSGYGPTQLTKAYTLPSTPNATTTPIIAIVDAYDDPNAANDLSKYSSTFGVSQLPTCSGAIAVSKVACFQKVNQTGSTSRMPSSNAGWALEISLDVQTAHASCQNCKILLVEANSSSFSDLLKAIDAAVAMGANVVSGSWGGSEFSSETAYDSHFNRPGVAFTFSAGDNGYGTLYPAASPYVTAVGGTSLLLNSDNSYFSETAWNGTGSGCSRYESKPAWQHDTLCTTRAMNDISADADPATGVAVYDSVRYYGQSGWFQVGGTSLSAPIIASVYALSGTTTGTVNALPYTLASATNLHDVTSGTNGSCGILCSAAAGYDAPTGLGTPNGVTAF